MKLVDYEPISVIVENMPSIDSCKRRRQIDNRNLMIDDVLGMLPWSTNDHAVQNTCGIINYS